MRERRSREMSGESQAESQEVLTAPKFSVISLPLVCSNLGVRKAAQCP